MSKKKNHAKTTKTPSSRAASNKSVRRTASAAPVETDETVETTSPAEVVEATEAAAPVETEVSQPVAEAVDLDAASDDDDDDDDAESDGTTDAAPTTKRTRPEIPKVGTVIKKIDRYGKVRCQCTVVDDGIRYKGKVYKSLSGAAMAAAKDLGLENKTQNGFTFWGITKPTRTITDPVATIGKSWLRYQTIATAALKAANEETREQVRAAIKQQGKALAALVGKAAE